MTSMEFTTAKRDVKPIVFTLDGEDYHFTPPKTVLMVLPMIDGGDDGSYIKARFDWVSAGLPEDENARLIARLRDNNDDFDLPDLGKIVDWLDEQVSGRPTTSPTDSSA